MRVSVTEKVASSKKGVKVDSSVDKGWFRVSRAWLQFLRSRVRILPRSVQIFSTTFRCSNANIPSSSRKKGKLYVLEKIL